MMKNGKRSRLEKALLFIPSLIIWLAWWTTAIILITLLLPLTLFVPRIVLDWLAHGICAVLLYLGLIFPRHKGNRPDSVPRPCIYVANHVSFFDLFVSGVFLPGHPRGLELKIHFSYPVYGWFITRFGMIPIEPGSRASVRRSFEEAITLMKETGRSLLVMPEGHRSKNGKVGKFQSGAFFISRKSGIPVVPIAYKRLFERNNRNSVIFRPGTCDIYLMDPVYPEDFSSDSEMADHVHSLISAKINE
jgi:1-acyl-sn-glycerol-3-phosphate acyltransferase